MKPLERCVNCPVTLYRCVDYDDILCISTLKCPINRFIPYDHFHGIFTDTPDSIA